MEMVSTITTLISNVVTFAGGLLLLFGAASCVNIILFLSMGGWMHYLFFPFVLFLVVVLMMLAQKIADLFDLVKTLFEF